MSPPSVGEVTVTVGAAGFSATSLTMIFTVIVSSIMSVSLLSLLSSRLEVSACSFLSPSRPSQTCTTTV